MKYNSENMDIKNISHTKKRFIKSALTLALGSALSINATQAQVNEESTENKASGIEKIVVTSRGRVQNINDVPVSVSVVSGDALDKRNITTLQDATGGLPNVKLSTGGLTNPIIIRGVGSGNNAGFEQSVGTFVDGLYRPRSQSTRSALMDLERLEVLKGPQTTFFGANAIAGALNITTKKAGDEFEYNVQTSYGDDNDYNLTGGVTIPLSDTFSVRLSGRVSGRDSYIENNNPDVEDDTEESQGRIAFGWQATDSIRSDLRIDQGKSRANGAFNFELVNCLPSAPFPGAAPTDLPFGISNTACQIYSNDNNGDIDDKLNYVSDSPKNYADYDFTEIAWTNQFDIFDGTLTSITGYFDQEYEARINPIPFRFSTSVNGYDPFSVVLNEEYDQFSQELRFESAVGSSFDYLLGAYYSESELYNQNLVGFYFKPFGLFAFGDPAFPVTGSPRLTQKDKVYSAFISGTYHLTDDLRINAGLRYSSINKKAQRSSVQGTAINNEPDTFTPVGPVQSAAINATLGSDTSQFAEPERTDKKLQPSIGLQFDASDDIMLYGTYSRGFKAGGYSAASNPIDYEPETVDAYELGMKGTFLDNTLSLNVAAFFSEYEDLQESTIDIAPNGSIVTIVKNAANSESKGLEASLTYMASDYVTLSADAGYLSAKYIEFPSAPCSSIANFLYSGTGSCSQDLAGVRRAFSPEYSGNLAANIFIPFDDMELRINPTIAFTSEYYLDATVDELLKQSGYAKLDLRLAFGPEDGSWEVALIGKNLTDRLTVSNFGQAVSTAPGSVRLTPDRQRNFALQFSIKSW